MGSFEWIVDLKHINFYGNISIFEVVVFQIFQSTENFLMTGNGLFLKDWFRIDRKCRNCIDPYPLEIDWVYHLMHSMCPILEHFLHFIVLGTLQSNSNLKQPFTFWSETKMESLPLSPWYIHGTYILLFISSRSVSSIVGFFGSTDLPGIIKNYCAIFLWRSINAFRAAIAALLSPLGLSCA